MFIIWPTGFSLNDINVLEESLPFEMLTIEITPRWSLKLMETSIAWVMGYYLVDGTYQSCATFVKTISNP